MVSETLESTFLANGNSYRGSPRSLYRSESAGNDAHFHQNPLHADDKRRLGLYAPWSSCPKRTSGGKTIIGINSTLIVFLQRIFFRNMRISFRTKAIRSLSIFLPRQNRALKTHPGELSIYQLGGSRQKICENYK